MILNPLSTPCVHAFLQYFLIRKDVEFLKYKSLRPNYVRYDKVTVLGRGRNEGGGEMHVELSNAGVAKGMLYEKNGCADNAPVLISTGKHKQTSQVINAQSGSKAQ